MAQGTVRLCQCATHPALNFDGLQAPPGIVFRENGSACPIMLALRYFGSGHQPENHTLKYVSRLRASFTFVMATLGAPPLWRITGDPMHTRTRISPPGCNTPRVHARERECAASALRRQGARESATFEARARRSPCRARRGMYGAPPFQECPPHPSSSVVHRADMPEGARRARRSAQKPRRNT